MQLNYCAKLHLGITELFFSLQVNSRSRTDFLSRLCGG